MTLLFPFATTGKHNPSGSLDVDYLLLYAIVAATRPKTIVETGTHAGVSAMAMAEALRHFEIDGVVHTIDNGARGDFAAQARKDAEQHELSRFIVFHTGNSQDVLPALLDELGTLDLAFLDGSHRYDDVQAEFNLVQHAKLVLLHDAVLCPGVQRLARESGALVIPTTDGKRVVGMGVRLCNNER